MTKQFQIQGMSCNHCVIAVKKELGKLAGIESADVQVGSAEVVFDQERVTETRLAEAIEEAGYVIVA